jgi:uncharacterized protein YcaQ
MQDQPGQLSIAQARRLHLAAQGLLRAPTRLPRRQELVATIRRLQLLQIDTIHVVARSPYLVLYSRLGGYAPEWLEEALADGEIGETWAHEACFVPSETLPLHRRHVMQRSNHWASRMAQRCVAKDGAEMAGLLTRVEREGALRSADFVAATPGQAGWWGWKPEKRWLEACFVLGRLMVARRERFQRVYDLPERVLRSDQLRMAWDSPPSADQVRSEFIERALIALGIARAEWLADYFRLDGKVSAAELRDRLPADALIETRVHGLEGAFFVHATHRARLALAARGLLRSNRCVPLSPFDPVVWDRRRAIELFDFDYRLECYLPAAKRRHGYFVLPLLDAGALIGRLDAKAHRRDGIFEIRRLHLERAGLPRPPQLARIARALHDIAAWHRTPRLDLSGVNDSHLRDELSATITKTRAQGSGPRAQD